jgi:hypothetical protein
MFKRSQQKNMCKRPLFGIAFICLTIFTLAACSSNGVNGSGSTSTGTATPTTTTTSTPVQTPSTNLVAFKVTGVDLVVNPNSIAGKVCGSSASFTYTATFHIPANTGGGTIQFQYTVNNGRASTSASVVVSPGETTKTYTFSNSGTLSPDHTYPGIAEVMVNSPNAVSSPQVKPAGTCTTPAFEVTSIDMAVSPASIAGRTCGTPITVTYTATFHIAANSPGGTIQFTYTVNNGRSSPAASVNVSPGQTTATYSFIWSGNLPPDHTYPGLGGVMTSSPNVVQSPLKQPTGQCS